MAEFINVNGQEYPAKFISKYQDLNWDKRETQTIYLTMSHDAAAALLPDNTPWSIVQRETVDVLDEQGQPTGETKEVVNEYDNSEYSLAGDITDHRDGTVSIKMGKPTETENAVGAVVALTARRPRQQRPGPHHARELAATLHPCRVDDHQRRPRGHAG